MTIVCSPRIIDIIEEFVLYTAKDCTKKSPNDFPKPTNRNVCMAVPSK